MNFTTTDWFLLVGGMLLILGLIAPVIRRVPATSAMIYLVVGMIVGPIGFGFFHFNPLKESGMLELFTEIAVLISLFAAGVKMPVPFNLVVWRTPLQFAFLSMAITVALVAYFSHFFLGLSLGAAILLGAIVAPTDPVLATDVQVRHAGDTDNLRFALTSEAGMNDGSAFPFVMLGLGLLGLHDLGNFGIKWFLLDVIWATVAGVAIGIAGGYSLAKIANRLRSLQDKDSDLLDDFLGLGLIATVYGVSVLFHAWGFLAVFAAAVALRQTEVSIENKKRNDETKITVTIDSSLPINIKQSAVSHDAIPNINDNNCAPLISRTSLVFKEHLERLSEVILVLLVGGMLFIDSWSVEAVIFALVLFVVIRPISIFLGSLGTSASKRVRLLSGWFGVRGIGSIYYLMYAIQHGVPEHIAVQLIHFTLVVITFSIFIHGMTAKPIMFRYGKPIKKLS